MIAIATLLVSLGAGAAAGLGSDSGPIWHLTSGLTDEQLSINALIYELLPPDECDQENEFDELAHKLAINGSPDDLLALTELEHGGGRKRQAAAGRAFVFIAQQSIALGDYKVAAKNSLHVYLSGVPHRFRLEALRAYCRSADPNESEKRINLIVVGRQDHYFTPALEDLIELRRLRIEKK